MYVDNIHIEGPSKGPFKGALKRALLKGLFTHKGLFAHSPTHPLPRPDPPPRRFPSRGAPSTATRLPFTTPLKRKAFSPTHSPAAPSPRSPNPTPSRGARGRALPPFLPPFLPAYSSAYRRSLAQVPNPDPLTGRPEHGGRDRHCCVGTPDLAPLRAVSGVHCVPGVLFDLAQPVTRMASSFPRRNAPPLHPPFISPPFLPCSPLVTSRRSPVTAFLSRSLRRGGPPSFSGTPTPTRGRWGRWSRGGDGSMRRRDVPHRYKRQAYIKCMMNFLFPQACCT